MSVTDVEQLKQENKEMRIHLQNMLQNSNMVTDDDITVKSS